MQHTPVPAHTTVRARSEADFHDARVSNAKPTRLNYAYVSVNDVYQFTRVPSDKLSGCLLEVGCFKGEKAVRLRGLTGSFIGIDISPAAIEHCEQLGLDPHHYSFRVDDANSLLTISDGSIDYAYGDGVLHHLDLARFSDALSRKLSPTGLARFVEPAVGNRILRTFRKLTPQMRTPDESPFDAKALGILREYFDLNVQYKALLRPFVPMLFLNNRKVIAACRSLDERLLRSSLMQSQAWLLHIELRRRGANNGVA